jgi:5'-nucleotidase
MNVLLSNDDGYQAPGIRALWDVLGELAWCENRVLVAPERNRSAASNALTLMAPLRMTEQSPNVYSVDGTPTDCVHLAVNGALEPQPDMVISGINAGANMGDDVLYSGTVAAATEGRFLGKPSIAVSLCGDEHFETAARMMQHLLGHLPKLLLDPNTILNINVPDRPYDAIKGVRITRLGKRHASEKVVATTDPRGKPIYWVGPAGEAEDASDGTDFHAVASGYVSITPLKIDLTHYDMQAQLNDWLSQEASLQP